MTSRERFQAVLRHEKDTPIPVWPQAFLFPGTYCKLSQKIYPTNVKSFVEAQIKAYHDFGWDAVKEAGGIACLHSCGQTTPLLEYMTGAGPYIIEIDYPHHMPDVVAEYPETVWLENLDPVTVLMQSQSDHIEQRVTELLEQVKGCGNFVLSTGCEPSMLTPPENMAAFMRAAKRFNGDDQG